MLPCLVEIPSRSELSCQQEARAGIDAQIGSGALEADGPFHCLALEATTAPEVDAGERGQALCEQSIVACAFGKLQGTARVILCRGRAGAELHDIGDVRVQGGAESRIGPGMVERLAKTARARSKWPESLSTPPRSKRACARCRPLRRLRERLLE